jgi:hypothetical protein
VAGALGVAGGESLTGAALAGAAGAALAGAASLAGAAAASLPGAGASGGFSWGFIVSACSRN